MIDFTSVKLGKKPVKFDTRTLKLADYLDSTQLPPPPPSVDNTRGRRDWGMMANDKLGCCTIAAVGHATQTLDGYGPSDEVVVDYYELWDGYNPSNPRSDQGGIELDVLTKWRQETFDGHAIQAFVSLNPGNLLQIKQAIELFGGVYIGVELPLSAQKPGTWDAVYTSGGEPGSWGGHAVWCPLYDGDGIVCVTWGYLQRMTYRFWARYCSESYAILSPAWPTWNGNPALDLKTLQEDLEKITDE